MGWSTRGVSYKRTGQKKFPIGPTSSEDMAFTSPASPVNTPFTKSKTLPLSTASPLRSLESSSPTIGSLGKCLCNKELTSAWAPKSATIQNILICVLVRCVRVVSCVNALCVVRVVYLFLFVCLFGNDKVLCMHGNLLVTGDLSSFVSVWPATIFLNTLWQRREASKTASTATCLSLAKAPEN